MIHIYNNAFRGRTCSVIFGKHELAPSWKYHMDLCFSGTGVGMECNNCKRTFFQGIPESMVEVAKIDGATEFYIFIRNHDSAFNTGYESNTLQIKFVISEYLNALSCGEVEDVDSVYNEIVSKLKTCESEKVKGELQKQADEYLKNK